MERKDALSLPTGWPLFEDSTLSFRIKGILGNVLGYLADAGMSLLLFEETNPLAAEPNRSADAWPPQELVKRRPWIHARGFVDALRMVERELEHLARITEAKQAADQALDRLRRSIPLLKQIRDAIQHEDERIRGMANRKAIPNLGGVVMHGNFFGEDVYSVLLDNGGQGSIAVTDQTWRGACIAVQALIDELPWTKATRMTWPSGHYIN